jgi:hypothetical protein
LSDDFDPDERFAAVELFFGKVRAKELPTVTHF